MIKKIFISTIVIFFALFLYCTNASSYKFTATPNNITAHAGDEVSISLNISDIDAGSDGINVVETKLQYDNSIFESVDFVQKNEWTSTYNSNQGENYGKLLYSKMITGVTSDEEIGIIKFKIKDDVQETETQIKLLQVTSNDGYQLMNDGDKIIKVKIISESAPIPTPSPEQEPEPEPQPQPDPKPDTDSTTNTVNEVSENATTQEQNVVQNEATTISSVQTGDTVRIVLLVLILAIILSIILYIYIKKSNNNNKHNK